MMALDHARSLGSILEGAAVPGQHERRLQLLDRFERGKEVAQRIVIGAPAEIDVWSDRWKEVISGDQYSVARRPQANVCARMAWSVNDRPRPAPGVEGLAARYTARWFHDSGDKTSKIFERGDVVELVAVYAVVDEHLAQILDRPPGIAIHLDLVHCEIVHPQLAARCVDDAPRHPVVVDVRMRYYEPAQIRDFNAGFSELRREVQPTMLACRMRVEDAAVEQRGLCVVQQHVGVDAIQPGERQG